VVAEFRRLPLQLLQRRCQPMSDLDLAPVEVPHQFVIVVAWDAECGACLDHPHHEPEHSRAVWPPVNKVAEEQHPAAGGRSHAVPIPIISARILRNLVPKLAEQFAELIEAAVHIADNVERS